MNKISFDNTMRHPIDTIIHSSRIFLLAFVVTATLSATSSAGAAPPEADRKSILDMAGEFEVIFQFEETVSLQEGYTIAKPYYEEAFESVFVVEDTGERIALQHILRVGNGIVKHWKQIWTWEDTTIIEYQGGSHWKVEQISEEDAAGTWSQLVTQTDDSPRYESSGTWTHDAGFSRWESGPTNRPLPRREKKQRDDYDLLRAVNIHALTTHGWIHNQENLKLVLAEDGSSEKYLAWEQGLNFYDRVDEPTFERVTDYWENTHEFWAHVSRFWDEVEQERSEYEVAETIDGKPMIRLLGEYADAINKGEKETPGYEDVVSLIEPYLVQ